MARPTFPGFPSEALTFFRGLARNNNRDWFLPRKQIFEDSVRKPMRHLVAALNGEMQRFAPLHVTDPDKAIYRIYRDTRFSKDKKPYKEHQAAYFPRRGLGKEDAAGYYFSISHQNLAIGGGVHMPSPALLLALRTHIAEHHAEFRRLIGAKALQTLFKEMHGEQLTRVPKGFSAEHPAADLLRYKQYVFYAELPKELITSSELFGEVRKRFEKLTPLVNFLNAPLDAVRAKSGKAGLI